MTWREKCSSARSWLPPNGRQYELFDVSAFLFSIGFVAFVVFQPPPSVIAALYGPLKVVSESQLGFLVTVTAFFGMVLSYHYEYLKLGYILPRIGAAFMFINFALSVIVLTVNWVLMLPGLNFLDVSDLEQVFRASFVYAMIFGWATRRLSRDEVE